MTDKSEKAVKKAAEEAVDADRLLDGEDPDTTSAEDAEHWAHVYRELVEFKEALLMEAQSRFAQMSGAARIEAEATDLQILTAESARLRHRLAYWTRRVQELSAK